MSGHCPLRNICLKFHETRLYAMLGKTLCLIITGGGNCFKYLELSADFHYKKWFSIACIFVRLKLSEQKLFMVACV